MKNEKTKISMIDDSEGGPCTGVENPEEHLKCVFSTTTTIKLGTGSTARKQRNKLLWYVKQSEDDAFGVRKINPQFVPVGEESTIDRETLLSDYTPEVSIHNKRVAPAMLGLTKTIAKGDKHRENGEPLSAEMEYVKALDVDEKNVRAIFGLGLVYMERNDTEKSVAVFEQLVAIEAAFDVKHKHLFNEFGIQLRKHEMYEEAAQYYSRAVEFSNDDENLYYNLARVHYEKNDWENCFANAALALKIDNNHEHAASLCDIILALSGSEVLREKYGKPPVPEAVAEGAAALTTAIARGDNPDILKLDLEQVGEVTKL